MGARGVKPAPLGDRFWPRVDVRGPDDCWEWLGYRHIGYGRINVAGKVERASRVAWLLAHGDIPLGAHICHHCDNPACCNVRHLFLGDAAANARDRTNKGRSTGGRLIGELHHQAKLTWAQVDEIREKYANGATNKTLRSDYGMSEKAIRSIVRDRSWLRPEAEHTAKAGK